MSCLNSTFNRPAPPPETASTKVSNGSATRCVKRDTTKQTLQPCSPATRHESRFPSITHVEQNTMILVHNLTALSSTHDTFTTPISGPREQGRSGVRIWKGQRCTLALQRLERNELRRSKADAAYHAWVDVFFINEVGCSCFLPGVFSSCCASSRAGQEDLVSPFMVFPGSRE